MKRFLFLILFGVNVMAAEPVRIRSGVDKAQVEAGESVTFSIDVEAEPEVAVTFPEIGNQILGFRIVDFGKDEPKQIEGKTQYRHWYELEADLSGSYVLPEVTIAYDYKGKKSSVKTTEIFVEVKAPAQGEDKGESADIRGLKDLQPVGVPWWVWAAAVVGILVLVALGYWWWKRRRFKAVIPEAVLEPHERALRHLSELEQGELSTTNLKRFHFHLSEIARTYLEGRYGLPATDMTLEEIRGRLNSVTALTSQQRMGYLELLNTTDSVKFAGVGSSKEASLELLGQAREFVKETQPAMEMVTDSIEKETGSGEVI